MRAWDRKLAIKNIQLESRLCECCGGNDLEPLWSSQSNIKTRYHIYAFPAHVVICRHCGFCFNSPCPTQESLNQFYAEEIPFYGGQPLPYSIELRQEILRSYYSKNSNLADIGGNNSQKFHSKLAPYFKSVKNVELNKRCPSYARDIGELKAKVDVITQYDVLEHISKVRDFLKTCYKVLSDKGVMIIEVPDVRLYPRNLMVFSVEHVNHFSVTTLATIAKSVGFKLIKISHLGCSRPFGFVSVYEKSVPVPLANKYTNYFEYLDTSSCIQDGIKQINNFLAQIESLKTRIIKLGLKSKKITLWCVTDFMRLCLEDLKLPKMAIVVDSDPEKVNALKEKKVRIFQPSSKLDHIKNSELLVIFSPRNKTNILEWIHQKTGKRFNERNLETVGCGLFGEPMQV